MNNEYSDTIDMKAFARVGKQLERQALGEFIAGSKAIVRTGNSKHAYSLHRVRSVGLKTGQITLDNGDRFLADGSQIGASKFHYKVLLRCTNDLEALAIRQQRLYFLEGIKWEDAAPDTMLEDIMRVFRHYDWDGVPE